MCIKTLVGNVMCLKRLITVPFESFEPFHLNVKDDGLVGAIPTHRVTITKHYGERNLQVEYVLLLHSKLNIGHHSV